MRRLVQDRWFDLSGIGYHLVERWTVGLILQAGHLTVVVPVAQLNTGWSFHVQAVVTKACPAHYLKVTHLRSFGSC
jgi:hypothetical protein